MQGTCTDTVANVQMVESDTHLGCVRVHVCVRVCVRLRLKMGNQLKEHHEERDATTQHDPTRSTSGKY